MCAESTRGASPGAHNPLSIYVNIDREKSPRGNKCEKYYVTRRVLKRAREQHIYIYTYFTLLDEKDIFLLRRTITNRGRIHELGRVFRFVVVVVERDEISIIAPILRRHVRARARARRILASASRSHGHALRNQRDGVVTPRAVQKERRETSAHSLANTAARFGDCSPRIRPRSASAGLGQSRLRRV